MIAAAYFLLALLAVAAICAILAWWEPSAERKKPGEPPEWTGFHNVDF